MWFCCVLMGTLATVVIIFNLWEKFQTNPTITGLDTDFHNWEVSFPAITVCQKVPTSKQKIEKYLEVRFQRNDSDPEEINFLMDLSELSIGTWMDFTKQYPSQNYIDSRIDLKELVFNLTYKCDEVFEFCFWKSYSYNCCDGFFPVFTENGFCYTFNSRHYERKIPGVEKRLPEFAMQYIQETDIEWSMKFKVKSMASHFSIYILNSDEIAGIDIQPQHIWDYRMETIKFSVKQTYTTEDTAQLSIKQRQCAFPNEIKLEGEKIYSYTACTRECRMKNAMKLCSCVPFFYPIGMTGYVHCNMDEMACIARHLEEIKSVEKCSCYLGCSNTVYEVEKLDTLGSSQEGEEGALNCKFVSWPMVRYKREVLFGWVDLLVSFGGIAGLFLGFSLLSGVEILYYFTMRTCCMVLKEKQELKKISRQKGPDLPPKYDSLMEPYSKILLSSETGMNFRRGMGPESWKNADVFLGNQPQLKSSLDVKPPFGIEFIN